MTPSLLRMAGDERLARMVTSGNDGAFAALYDRYHDVLVRYCRSLVRDDQDALDAFQSTMLNALRALRDDRRRAPVRPWLFRIAHNESISVLRRRPTAEPLDDRQVATLDVHRRAEDREALAGLLEDLGTLTEHQRGALLLRELGGLAYEDVATALETTPLAARQAVFAARASLHDQRAGRELDCALVQRRLSDTDRRASRTRAVRAHLRTCDDCRGFANAIGRRRRAVVLLPIPPAFASSGLLTSILDAGSGATAVGGGAVATGLAAKAAVALSAAVVATGAAEGGAGPAKTARVEGATTDARTTAKAEATTASAARVTTAAAPSAPVEVAAKAPTETKTTPRTTAAAPTTDDDAEEPAATPRGPVRLAAGDDDDAPDFADDPAPDWRGHNHERSDAARPFASRPRRPRDAAPEAQAEAEAVTPAPEPPAPAPAPAPETTTAETATTPPAATTPPVTTTPTEPTPTTTTPTTTEPLATP
jgi:RNA polymerase sigma factor (sigma-70 family)